MKYLFAICLFTISLSANAQKQLIDSLKQALNKTKDQSSRAQQMIEISRKYIESAPDSAMLYAQRALTLSEQLKDKEKEANSLSIIGNLHVKFENDSIALQYHIKALKIREELKDEEGMAKSYNNIGRVYTENKDYEHALSNYFKASPIFEKIIQQLESGKTRNNDQENKLLKNKWYLSITLLNIGDTYDRSGKLDSALEFQNKANSLAQQVHDSVNISYSLINLGAIYLKKGNPEFALSNYKQSVRYLLAIDDKQGLSVANRGLAEVYEKTGHIDSAIRYARIALHYAAEEEDFKKERHSADTLLSKLFKSAKKIDSALYYYELATATMASMNMEKKSIDVQNIKSLEILRQLEMEKQKAKDLKERANNLQMLGIALFITTFLAVLVVLSRRKTKHKSFKYLGIIGLLLLFEFIMYFIHPYIANFTHHTPVYILIITVGVAALLSPLHHRFTDLVEIKLAKRHRGRPRKATHPVTHRVVAKHKNNGEEKRNALENKTD